MQSGIVPYSCFCDCVYSQISEKALHANCHKLVCFLITLYLMVNIYICFFLFQYSHHPGGYIWRCFIVSILEKVEQEQNYPLPLTIMSRITLYIYSTN